MFYSNQIHSVSKTLGTTKKASSEIMNDSLFWMLNIHSAKKSKKKLPRPPTFPLKTLKNHEKKCYPELE